MNTPQLFAFFGTGQCNPSDQRNAALGQLATLIISVLLISFIYKHLIRGKRAGEKIVGYIAIVLVAVTGLGIAGFIYLGVACGRY